MIGLWRLDICDDGCFWIESPRNENVPVHNAVFWRRKLGANRARDRLVNQTLRRAGWSVVRVWEHALRDEGRAAARVARAIGRGAT